MKALVQYTSYEISDTHFRIRAKVSPKGITLVNKNKNFPHTFEFNHSSPELLADFAKAINVAVKLAKQEKA